MPGVSKLQADMHRAMDRLIEWDVRYSGGAARRVADGVSRRWQLARQIALLGAHVGDGLLWAALGLVAFAWSGPVLRGRLVIAGGAVVLAGAMSWLIKLAIRRERPPSSDEHRWFYLKLDAYAFPSGHAARVFCIAAMMSELYPAWQAPMWFIALWVGASRVALGAHHILDVVAGGLIGVAVGELASYAIGGG